VRIVWSARAVADLRAIAAYIRQDSPGAARRITQQLRNVTRRLTRFPLSGRIVPELAKGPYRELIVRDYRIIYRLTDRQPG
jgi:addiction module RelE/StbE family toxin